MQSGALTGSAPAAGGSSLQQAGQQEDELERDFAADSPATKPGASDSDYSDHAGAYDGVSSLSEPSYDDSEEEGGRRKRRAKQRSPGAKRPRVETHMTRKLRSNGEALGDAGFQGTSAEDSWGLEGQQQERGAPSPTPEGPDDADDVGPLERPLSEEQAAADLANVRSMWELAAAFQFLGQFQHWLGLSQAYSLSQVEEELVRSPGPGLLASLHLDLLKGISPRTPATLDSWADFLSNRLVYEATAAGQSLQQLPFKAQKSRGAWAYAALGIRQRVLAFKLLCDHRADREDIRALMAEALQPAKASSAVASGPQPRSSGRSSRSAAKTPPPPPSYSLQELRGRSALGQDAAGCSYHWFDFPLDPERNQVTGMAGSRLYKEWPPLDPEQQQQQQQQQSQSVQGDGGEGVSEGRQHEAEKQQGASKPPTPASSGQQQQQQQQGTTQGAKGSKQDAKGSNSKAASQNGSAAAAQNKGAGTSASPGDDSAAGPLPGRVRRAAAESASAKITAQSKTAPKPPPVRPRPSSGGGGGGERHQGSGSRRSRKRRAAFVMPADEVAGRWELVADGVDEMEAVAVEMASSGREQDAALGRLILDELVPLLLDRKEREERFHRAQAKLSSQLGGTDAGRSSGRPMRQRKVVNYSFDDYDKSVKDAIRAAERGAEAAPDRWALPPREGTRTGLRKGGGRAGNRDDDDGEWQQLPQEHDNFTPVPPAPATAADSTGNGDTGNTGNGNTGNGNTGNGNTGHTHNGNAGNGLRPRGHAHNSSTASINRLAGVEEEAVNAALAGEAMLTGAAVGAKKPGVGNGAAGGPADGAVSADDRLKEVTQAVAGGVQGSAVAGGVASDREDAAAVAAAPATAVADGTEPMQVDAQ